MAGKSIKTVNGFELIHKNPKTVNPALLYLASLSSQVSRKCMASKLNRFAQFFGYKDLTDCDWEQMRTEHIVSFLASQPWDSERTYNCYLSVLKSVAKACWQSKLMDREDLDRIQSIKQHRVYREQTGRAIDFDEAKKMFTAAAEESTHPMQIRDKAIYTLLLGCGLRRNEVAELRLKRVHINEQRISVIGKGNKERSVYLSGLVYESLIEWLEIRNKEKGKDDSGFVFCRVLKNGRLVAKSSLDPASVGRVVQKLCDKSGIIDKVTTHDLRRTFATRLIEKNVDIVEVQKLMGHESVTTTGNYVRKKDEKLKEAANKIELF